MERPNIEGLSSAEAAATPAPWYEVHTDDDLFMNMAVISTMPHARHSMCQFGECLDSGNVVAATLLQSPRLVDVADQRWDENIALIVALRNAWPAVAAYISHLESTVETLQDFLRGDD